MAIVCGLLLCGVAIGLGVYCVYGKGNAEVDKPQCSITKGEDSSGMEMREVPATRERLPSMGSSPPRNLYFMPPYCL